MSNRFGPAFALLLATLVLPAGIPTVALAIPPSEPPGSIPLAGTITGTVTDDRGQQPIPGVQIQVIGTTLGAITDAEGKYRIVGVSAGTVTLRARRLGFTAADRSVTVRDEQTLTVDFALAPAPVSLDALVVTGTPGGTQVRAIGNAVERLDAVKAKELSPAVNVQQLLGQRTAGVTVLPNSGMVGTGSAVRIRGAASLSLTNQPIIYVDGVRVDNDPAAGPSIRQGRQAARLNDFNPEDIESMEIIKGPAAATLYGTEASNGVIQIITKRGKVGKPQLAVSIREGRNFLADAEDRMRFTYGINPNTQQVDSINMITYYKQTTGKDIFTSGPLHNVNASLSGGSEGARYFISGDWLDNEGLVDYNWVNAISTRANLQLLPSSKWQINTTADFVRNETRFAQAFDQFGIWEMLVYSSPALLNSATKGFRYANPEVAAQVDSRSKVNRFTGGIDMKHMTTGWLTQQFKAGMDVGNTTNQILFPRPSEDFSVFYGARSVGEKTLENVTTSFTTLDYAATATANLFGLESSTSLGAQYYQRRTNFASEFGRNFPTADVTTIGGAATTTASEDYVENKTLGMYVQEQLSWNDRVFLTGALRGDANSAFGEDFDAAYYPKVSATWVVNEEGFWKYDMINTFRLRGAWGQAGQQPDVFDAVTLYTPATGPGDVPILTPGSLGNPKLKPERGSELELGFDAAFLDDRITLAYTRFDRRTKDAIVRQPVQPSAGFPGVRVVNLGEMKSWGNEVTLTARVLDQERLGWDLSFNYGTARNRIVSLGGLPPIILSASQEHRVGYAAGSSFSQKVVSADFSPTGSVINAMCDGGPENNNAPVPCANAPKVYWGQPTPTWTGSVNNTLTLLGNIRLSALIDFQGGHLYEDGEIQAGHQNFQNTAASNPETDPIFATYQSLVPRAPLGFFDAGFSKLRELAASYTLTPGLARRLGFSNASITGAWRNVGFVWQAQKEVWGTKLFDSEMRTPGSELGSRYQTMIPPASQFVFTVRTTF